MRNNQLCIVEEYLYNSQTFTIGVKRIQGVLKRCVRNQEVQATILALRKKRRDIRQRIKRANVIKRKQAQKKDFENRHVHHGDKYLRDDFDSKKQSVRKRRKCPKERRKKPNYRKQFYKKFKTSVEDVDDKPFTSKPSLFEYEYQNAINDAYNYYEEVYCHCDDYNENPFDDSPDCYSDKTHHKGERLYAVFYYDDYYYDIDDESYQHYEDNHDLSPVVYRRYPNPFIEFRLHSIYNLSFKLMKDYPSSSLLLLNKTYYQELKYRIHTDSLNSLNSFYMTHIESQRSAKYKLFKSFFRLISAKCLLKDTYGIDYDVIQRIISYI